MKVLSNPRGVWKNFEVTCKNKLCQAVLEVEEGDMLCSYSRSDGPHPETYSFLVRCVVCEENISILQGDLPITTIQKLKKKADQQRFGEYER